MDESYHFFIGLANELKCIEPHNKGHLDVALEHHNLKRNLRLPSNLQPEMFCTLQSKLLQVFTQDSTVNTLSGHAML